MRSFTKTILAAVLFAASSGLASADPTLNVHIQDQAGAPVPFVTVAAIEFGMNGPSTYTQVGLTNGSGNAAFTLSSGTYGRSYNLYYTSHSFSPSISDQFNNPEYDPNRYIWAQDSNVYFSTFTITQNLTDVGMIRQEFTGATAGKVLFGGVWNMKSQMQGASGIVIVAGDTTGTLAVDNVPHASANTYNIGLYDPEKNQGIGRNVMEALSDINPVISYLGGAKLDFNKAVPPARVADNPAPGGTGEAASGASVEGVMMSTSGKPIPWMGIEVKACDGFEWRNWAHVGEDGRFKLYGLTPGVTYYVSAHGGCTWNHENQESKCYEPFASPNFNAGDICSNSVNHSLKTDNDIVTVSTSDALFHRVVLNEMPKSIGQMRVYVKSSSGLNMPNANVSVNPDGSPWPVDGQSCSNEQNYMQYFSTNFFNSPGLSNQNSNTSATGYALLDGLPSGNYRINVWTPFSSGNSGQGGFNAGPDGEFGWGNNNNNCSGPNCWTAEHCQTKGADDFRVTITTWTTPTFHIYNSSGNVLQYDVNGNIVSDGSGVDMSSITYIVEAGGINLNGLVRGTARFPGITDLSANPIMITLYPQCDTQGPCGAMGNFTAIDGAGADHYDYSISVSTGYSYHMQVKGVGWGRVKNGGGEDQINLTSTGTAVVDMNFSPAGSVSGTLYKPVSGGGKEVVTPSNNQWIWVGVNSDRGWSGAQLQKDGTFEMTDVLPGVNRLYVNASGQGNSTFNYALPSPTPVVNVIAGSTMSVDVNLVDATLVGADLDLAKVPDPTIIKRSSNSYDTVLGFKVIPVPAGTVLKADAIRNMFFGKGGDENQMRYSGITGPNQEGPCGRSWPGGFCAARVASPSVYDFYLMRAGDFGDMQQSSGPVTNSPWPHYVLLTSSKNVIVDAAHATGLVNAGNGSTTPVSGVSVNLTPATDLSGRGNATLAGNVTADNFFRQVDYDALGGDFEKFMEYLPMVMLYDSNGAFKATGIVVPPMEFIRQHEEEFDLAFAQGYEQFRAVFNSPEAALGFEIRGLKPLECFTAVVTTPNYPPYQTKTCMGANKSTTTITVNLDSAVGVGATVSGVVTSTATPAVKLANALVELFGEGVDKSAVTNSSGAYTFEGLPRGTVRLKVTAEGYAQADSEQGLVGSNSYTQNFALNAAGGSITGTVYTQKLPYAKVQAGAQIVAYNDTFNGTTTGATALIRTLTGADGTYKLTGLVPGDVYKVFLKVPGKYTLSLTTTAILGNIPDMDFTTKPKWDIEMSVEKTESAFKFTVKNPGDFKTGEARYKQSPYTVVGSTALNMVKNSVTGDLEGSISVNDLTPGITYVLHGAATSYSNKFIEKELQFGKGFKGSSQQHIDEYILGDQSSGDNAAPLVGSEDPSAIVFPPGAVQASGIPTCTSKGEDKDDSAVADKVAVLGADAFAGDLYTVVLTSVSVNEGKSIELSLAYDKNNVTEAEVSELVVARFNDTTQDWEPVPGLPTPNKEAGTLKVKLKTLASVLSVRGGVAPQFNRFDGKQYVVRPQAVGAGGAGTFAVVKPSVAGTVASGAKLKVFNYPNPFNLKNKSLPTNNGGASLPATTYGTVIHVEVPAGNGGPGHVRIYTLAGELVKDIKVDFTSGVYNYVAWDGHNEGGQEVANGVYYGVVEMTGKKPKLKDATFKMAVIK